MGRLITGKVPAGYPISNGRHVFSSKVIGADVDVFHSKHELKVAGGKPSFRLSAMCRVPYKHRRWVHDLKFRREVMDYLRGQHPGTEMLDLNIGTNLRKMMGMPPLP